MNTFGEEIVAGFRYDFDGEGLASERSPFQQIDVYENPSFGRVLALDGLTQTTEHDEFIYHEMIVHVPLLALEDPKRVLIIGGGDGGTLRRVLEHPVERAVMVEIDERVTELCRKFMPAIGGDAWDDPRADVRFDDGIAFVRDTDESFDAILIDSSDPVGPGEGLFTPEFYGNVLAHLAPGGLVCAQSGSPYFQQSELWRTSRSVREVFTDTRVFLANVPTYPGCLWCFTLAGDRVEVDAETAAARAQQRAISARYWTPEVQVGAFALNAIARAVIESDEPPHTWGMSPAETERAR